MKNPIGPFILSMLFLITFLLISNYAYGKTKSQWLNENPCMIKTITTSVTKNGVTTITKEEVLKCQDGYDGPNYWELFAQFYYADLSVPAYCRYFARPDHPFKTPGLICLNEKGVWEEQ
jgi:hypothetical protein|tara:strand:- start:14 stop:370 length:357 start_codon:yes stop_codon:yes gene_type:complete